MDEQRIKNTLQGLRALERESLSIIQLSEASGIHSEGDSRASDGSQLEIPTPASLRADLAHYKVRLDTNFLVIMLYTYHCGRVKGHHKYQGWQ